MTTTTAPDPLLQVQPALATVRTLMRAINDGDLSPIDRSVTADFVDHGSPVPLPPGPAGYRQVLGYVTSVLDISYEVLEEIVTPDRVVLRARAHGRGVAAVHGPGNAGKPYVMDTIHVFRTEGRLLAEHWGVRDELSVLVQLGLVPSLYPGDLDAPISSEPTT
jgi:ketosteroid isomerase-like protein